METPRPTPGGIKPGTTNLGTNPQAYTLDRPFSRADSAEIARRRRGRNLALLAVLVGLIALFYAISVARLLRG